MTDSKARIDPRYDPRFQRGYVGGETDGPPHAESPPPTSPVVAPVPVTREPRKRAEFSPEGVESERERATFSPEGVEREREPAPPAVPTARRLPVAETAPESEPEPAGEPVPAPEPDRLDDEAASRVRSWLIAGWAVTVGAVALGAWMSWTVNSDSGMYFGRSDPSGEVLRTLGWSLSPALLMAGALGAVVVTGFAAVLQEAGRRRDPARSDDAGGFRRTPAWWALAAIAVGGIVLIAWSVGLATEGNAASSRLIFDGNGIVSEAQQATLTTMALGQFAQAAIGPIAFAVVAAFVAIVVVEVQRFSARRAR